MREALNTYLCIKKWVPLRIDHPGVGGSRDSAFRHYHKNSADTPCSCMVGWVGRASSGALSYHTTNLDMPSVKKEKMGLRTLFVLSMLVSRCHQTIQPIRECLYNRGRTSCFDTLCEHSLCSISLVVCSHVTQASGIRYIF